MNQQHDADQYHYDNLHCPDMMEDKVCKYLEYVSRNGDNFIENIEKNNKNQLSVSLDSDFISTNHSLQEFANSKEYNETYPIETPKITNTEKNTKESDFIRETNVEVLRKPSRHSIEGKMFIGGLAPMTSEADLKSCFERFGRLIDCIVMRDTFTGRPRGFGFVTFNDPNNLEVVLSSGPIEIDGRVVDVKAAVPRKEDEQMCMEDQKTQKIFVGGIGTSIGEQDLQDYFNQFGKVVDVQLMYDGTTQRPRGFAFVTFEEDEIVEKLVEKGFYEIGDQKVEVKKATPKILPNSLHQRKFERRYSPVRNDYNPRGFRDQNVDVRSKNRSHVSDYNSARARDHRSRNFNERDYGGSNHSYTRNSGNRRGSSNYRHSPYSHQDDGYYRESNYKNSNIRNDPYINYSTNSNWNMSSSGPYTNYHNNYNDIPNNWSNHPIADTSMMTQPYINYNNPGNVYSSNEYEAYQNNCSKLNPLVNVSQPPINSYSGFVQNSIIPNPGVSNNPYMYTR